jgi:hypothetical protein
MRPVGAEVPQLFQAVFDGRLHLTAVLILGPRLTPANADELIREAEHMTRIQIEELLAARFPRTESLPLVLAMPAQLAPERVAVETTASLASVCVTAPPRRELAPERVGPRRKVQPIAKQRFLLNVMIDQETRDLLQRVQELMSHQIASGDVAEVLKQSLKQQLATLEKRKFATTARPRPTKGSTNPRYIPASVRRAVHERDGNRCTFVSSTGHRCEECAQLEYDHVKEVARGGVATIDNIRLRCRAHNQFVAGRTFGADFMARRRREAIEKRIMSSTRSRASSSTTGVRRDSGVGDVCRGVSKCRRGGPSAKALESFHVRRHHVALARRLDLVSRGPADSDRSRGRAVPRLGMRARSWWLR